MAQPNRSAIKAKRIALGLKRPVLAEEVDISYKHLWGIEAGTHVAAVEVLSRIAARLGLDLHEVMHDDSHGGTATEGADSTTGAGKADPAAKEDEADEEVSAA